MKTKKCGPSSSPRRKSSKKVASSGKTIAAQKTDEDARKLEAPRRFRRSTIAAEHILKDPVEGGNATAKPVKFFLAREGVAFGPYTEFQLCESVRLGIFEPDDLALAEDGKEWLEVSHLLPVCRAHQEQPPVTSLLAKENDAGLETSELPRRIEASSEQPPAKPRFQPLTEQQLREHEMLFATPTFPALIAELMGGRFAFATLPIVVMVLGLLTTVAVCKHRELTPRAQARAGLSQAASAVQAPAKIGSASTNNSLPAYGAPPANVMAASTSDK